MGERQKRIDCLIKNKRKDKLVNLKCRLIMAKGFYKKQKRKS